ncbi:thioredoxin domain-containing protein [Azoarcus sp. DN11]|uniref:thioredoxin domain-containing protein n=1 Tax=Azoarcus sp. DN11 TaxID=356837 RepID=UPI000EADA7BA|nr:thioredoxin domain-containing protein [Azoarcus sp. DN11]AYH42177.1 hypothetical protein CDA09_02045 [Azoarcus sp. DN11]
MNRMSAGALLRGMALAASVMFAAGPGHCDDASAGDTGSTHRYTNRLIDSDDPYLLLHAHNPVDWYPWGPEALAKAKRENRPIFISVGYSTCYWCHVAERMIYSNPEIAKLMNDWFINIKIDREQRPDIDGIYMLATQLMAGHGGWPNNVFLTPDLKPFFAGSYFPPNDDGPGRPGFPTVLKAIHDAWSSHPADVLRRADAVLAAMRQVQQQDAAASVPIEPAESLAKVREELLREQDAKQGGLNQGTTKFPNAPALSLLLADYRATRNVASLAMLKTALDAMALGGIHDQLGGGLHRYSTEPSWSIPHFEKMLYDNAQLLRLYAETWQLTRVPLYRAMAEDIAAYLEQRMMAPAGGFYAAQDAEVGGREGASYLWHQTEIEAILGKVAARHFFRVYALTTLPDRAPSPTDDPEGVLRVRVPLGETLKRAGDDELTRVLAALAPSRDALRAARERRAQPARDEKIIVAWNALAIDALARSGQILDEAHHIALARQAASVLWEQAFDSRTGDLKHEIFHGRAQIPAYLDDYALFGSALLSLGETSGEAVWQQRAQQVGAAMLRRFWHADGLATTQSGDDLLLPPPQYGDHAAPSGPSAALELLARLHIATGKAVYADAAESIVVHLGAALTGQPGQWPSAIAAMTRYPLPADETARKHATDEAKVRPGPPSSADHVHARGEVRRTDLGDMISITLVVDPGYHVNANPATFDYLIPTRVSFKSLPGIPITYPDATVIRPQFAPEGLKTYEGTVNISARVAKPGALPVKAIDAEVSVQACNDEACLPPATLPLVIPGK